jgi:hypothetical protein
MLDAASDHTKVRRFIIEKLQLNILYVARKIDGHTLPAQPRRCAVEVLRSKEDPGLIAGVSVAGSVAGDGGWEAA